MIKTKLINRRHDNLLVSHFGINKIWELITQKYHWLTLYHNVEAYIISCNIWLTLKIVWPKLYSNFQSLQVFTHEWKNLLIDFVMELPISTNWKSDTYNSILVIINRFIKMLYYKSIKVTIDISGLVKIILDVII